MRPHMSKPQSWFALLVGLTGVVTALALPFAPVLAETTTLTWPAPGEPATSGTALVVPYRPNDLTASIPCAALRAAAAAPEPVTVLATGAEDDGVVVTGSAGEAVVRLDGREERVRVPAEPQGCRVVIESTAGGMSILGADGRASFLAGQPVPQVFGFRTDLDPRQAAGLSVTVVVGGPFATSPTVLKTVLVGVQVLSVVLALYLLRRDRGPRPRRRPRWRRTWWIDAAVVVVLGGWAVIGPLAVDDGWATTIARNAAATGNPGNYYRWWDAAEVPFALCQQLLAPLTQISIAPLWLRLPSTLLAVATWFVVSRGVLGAALPSLASTTRVRILAAVCLLVTWLPFNLGTRPESYVALGVAVVLALALRARRPADLGWIALAVGLTVPISPNGILVAAPIVVFAPRLAAAARATTLPLTATVALTCCIGAVALSVIFGEQTWDALVTATDWHTYFGPSLPWYEEPTRYQHLLQDDQQGSFAKRVPVLFTIVLVPVVVALGVRRRDRLGTSAMRMAAVMVVALLLLAAGPSKWSYHLGAAAGVFASFLTVAVVLLVRRARTADRRVAVVGAVGSVLVCAAAALAFSGPNAWWLPAIYDVPWATGPVQPAGVPLNNPLVWVGLVVAGSLPVLVLRRGRTAQICALGPAVVTVVVFGTVVTLLVGTFATAPLRRSSGSLAMVNLDRISSTRVCGLADDVEVLPDGAVLAAAEPGGRSSGFAAMAGFYPGAPPPDPPGTGTSAYLWGSRTTEPTTTGAITTQWFVLPPLEANAGVAVSVSGRGALTLEFGNADGPDVAPVGATAVADRPASDEDPAHPLWRSVGVDAVDVPVGADRVRIRAVDERTDDAGWLAFTGPRLRTVVPLTTFLADKGPVLVSWPQSFLFPCVHDIAGVSGGVAHTPRVVIESPRPWLTDDRNPDIGGTFAGLAMFGRLNEIPSRLVGHPEVDWGAITVSGDSATRDSYARTTTRTQVWGIGATRDERPERRR
jgi:arabinosyltransferase B